MGSERDDDTRTFPGAHAPDRTRRVSSGGLGIAVHEWGPADGPPLLLAHGGFDFARTYDVFAPKLAAAGWRVVSWDQRGHGDSEHAALYQWEADMRDAIAVFDATAPGPLPLVGHSKGGSLVTQLAGVLPHRVAAVVNIDGIPSRGTNAEVQDHERTKLLAKEISGWLDHRRRAEGAARKPGTIPELAARRARMNPRLSAEWLEYLVTVGGFASADGWRWKIDPTMRMGGFGPWRPEWSLSRVADVAAPFLALFATETEVMGWGTEPADVAPFLPAGAEVVAVEGAGHFVHIEQPDRTAALILDHLATACGAP